MEFTIKNSLLYPFKNFKSLWNFWWVLLPVFGWFFFGGYILQVLKAILTGNDEGLPKREGFWINFIEGIKLVVFLLPVYAFLMLLGYITESNKSFMIVYVAFSIIVAIHLFFAVAKYSIKRKFDVLYDFKDSYQKLKKHFKLVMVSFAMTIIVSLIWLVASLPLITLLLTYPALIFSQYFIVGKVNEIILKK